MSLEEFLGDESLGKSMWSEEDFNIDSINNTTNIDLLKKDIEHGSRQPAPAFGSPYGGPGGLQSGMGNPAPPYIIKFLNLPPIFANSDLEDLFNAKFTKFKKFKIFWELNKNPSIQSLVSGSKLEQHFIMDSKVAFVEVFSFRDMDKILKYWATPLKEIYNLTIIPADFQDFKEYVSKMEELVKESVIDSSNDPAKPHKPNKSKSHEKDVVHDNSKDETRSKNIEHDMKTLQIDEHQNNSAVDSSSDLKTSKYHMADENLSGQGKASASEFKNDGSLPSLSGSQAPKKPVLSYSQVAQKSIEELASKNSMKSSPESNKLSINAGHSNMVANVSSNGQSDKPKLVTTEQSNMMRENQSIDDRELSAYIKDLENNELPRDHHNDGRNTGYSERGGGFNRNNFNNRSTRGNRGDFKGSRGDYNKRGNYNNGRGGGNGQRGNKTPYRKTYDNSNNDNAQNTSQSGYSMFKPVSSFLQNDEKFNSDDNRNSNNRRGGGGGGGFSGRGRYNKRGSGGGGGRY